MTDLTNLDLTPDQIEALPLDEAIRLLEATRRLRADLRARVVSYIRENDSFWITAERRTTRIGLGGGRLYVSEIPDSKLIEIAKGL